MVEGARSLVVRWVAARIHPAVTTERYGADGIPAEFDKLNKLAQKSTPGTQIPKIYIKTIAELEDFLNDTVKDKAAVKKMNAANARALNAIKQRIKKNNREYESQIALFRKDNDAFMAEEEEAAPAPKPKKTVIQNVAPDAEDDDDGFETVDRRGKAVTYTPESIYKHLRTILESRGKKNTDRAEQIRIMEKLLEIANIPYAKIRVLLTLISTRFDLSTGALNYMAPEQWKQ